MTQVHIKATHEPVLLVKAESQQAPWQQSGLDSMECGAPQPLQGTNPLCLLRFPVSVNATWDTHATITPHLNDRMTAFAFLKYTWYVLIDLYSGNNNWCANSITSYLVLVSSLTDDLGSLVNQHLPFQKDPLFWGWNYCWVRLRKECLWLIVKSSAMVESRPREHISFSPWRMVSENIVLITH